MKILKLRIKVLLILLNDIIEFNYVNFSKKQKQLIQFSYSIRVTQEIKPSETFENKIFNLRLAAARINEHIIMPGELFSFWHIIGYPGKRFKHSLGIKRGILTREAGGGVCQVSGIIYHLSILAGLQIVERHNHSIDLYTNESRFTPLGTDATVGYGNRFKGQKQFCLSNQILSLR